MSSINLFDEIPADSPQELFTILAESPHVRIERIVSQGHTSPPDFWYDQPQAEWVTVLRGAARLEFEGVDQHLEMKPGDCTLIPAHRKHRVAWTALDEQTVWLAIHFEE